MHIINIFAILLGPIIAVGITLWYQSRKQKKDIQYGVFFNLMAHRKNYIHPDRVNALNTIDIVFHKNEKILKLWHEYFEMLCKEKPNENEFKLAENKYLDLLLEIARELKLKKITQTDIDKFFTPKGQIEKEELQINLQREMLRIMQNSKPSNPTQESAPTH